MTTVGEWEEVKALASGEEAVHIGGSNQEEEMVWSWSDGSPWVFTQWNSDVGSRGDSMNCLEVYKGGWTDYYCSDPCPFICQITTLPSILTAQRTITIEYTKENLSISSFEVNYQHSLTSQELLDSWEDRSMTGFR